MSGATTRPLRVLTTAGPVPVAVCQLCAALVLALDGGEAAHDAAHRAALRGDDEGGDSSSVPSGTLPGMDSSTREPAGE